MGRRGRMQQLRFLFAVLFAAIIVKATPTRAHSPSWANLYGDAGFSAFSQTRGTGLPRANWTHMFTAGSSALESDGIVGPWHPAANPAIGTDGTIVVGVHRTFNETFQGSPPATQGVMAFNGATGDQLWLVTLDTCADGMVLITGSNDAVVVGPGCDVEGRGTDVYGVVLDVRSGAKLATQALLKADPDRPGAGLIASLSHDTARLYVATSASKQARQFNISNGLADISSPVELPQLCAAPLESWSGTSAPGPIGDRFVYLHCSQLVILQLQPRSGALAWLSPPQVSVRTYSIGANRLIYMNWGDRIVAVDLQQGRSKVVHSVNVSRYDNAHDTMADQDLARGTVFVPVNFTAPSSLWAFNPDLSRKWTVEVPSGMIGYKSLVQTIRSPFTGPNPGTITALVQPTPPNSCAIRMWLMDGTTGAVFVNTPLPAQGDVIAAITADQNLVYVAQPPSSLAAGCLTVPVLASVAPPPPPPPPC